MGIFQLTITQIVTMFSFILIGYVMRKTKLLPDNASKILSTLLVNVCMPALIFLNCASNMRPDKIVSQGQTVLIGVVVLLVSYVVGFFLAKLFSKDAFERKVYTYSFTIPNIGYMGAPLVEVVFGEEVLFSTLMFVFPMYIFIYSKGLRMLSPHSKGGIVSVIAQPNIIAIAVGMLVGLSGIKLPGFIENIASSAKDCVGPVAMILTGCVLAGKNFLKMLKDFRVYIASVLRLLVIPFAAVSLMLLMKIPTETVLAAGAMLSMPLGLNTVVFPEAYGGDGSKGASLALISHTMSLATIPLVFYFLSRLL